MVRLQIAGILAAAALIACSPGPPTASPSIAGTPGAVVRSSPPEASPTPPTSAERDAGWRSDLEMLVPAMAGIHPNLTHGVSREALDAAVTSLVGTIPDASNDELLDGVLGIVAMVSKKGCDAHTGAFVWGTGTYPVDSLPLRLWLFPSEPADALVIVDALPPYRDLIGSTIDTIDGDDELDVRNQLMPLVPRDNDWTFRLLAPRYLLIPQVLRGLGVAADGPISLGLTAPDGSPRTVDISPIPMAEYNAWAGPYGLHLPANPDVLYLSRIDDALSWTRLANAGTLYVQWNRVDRLPLATTNDLRAELRKPDVDRVILDLRHNYGGEVSALDPMLEMFGDPALDRPGRLFVITGRNTFSAASLFVARIDRDTDATIVGEPMGGCPTAYGDAEELTLPYSGIVVDVADLLEVGVAADDARETIEPDLAAPLTLADWIHGTDPAVGMITTPVP